jgi:hypothetical protein
LRKQPAPWRHVLQSLLASAIVAAVMAPPVGVSAATVSLLSGTVSLTQSLTVTAGQTLRFDPNVNTTVEISGNLVVHGTLEMKPQPGVTHTLRFVGVNESAFIGGGMEVLETDRGLWVMGSGKLDIVGEPKAGWNRLGTDPTWDSSDELVVAPTVQGDYEGFGKFTLGTPVPRADASVPPTEVINLTRSVRIEGMPGARSHVIIMSSVPQTVRYAAFRHMGPRQSLEGGTEGVLGRYPLHFHMAGDGSRGSIVEGNVVRDSGNRAFVPHSSHGITLRDNVAYDVMDTPYWWDVGEATHDSLWEHNFAGVVDADPQSNEHPVLSGFVLGEGAGNVARGNAAAGILGNTNCSGFHWPSKADGIWEFAGNVAHNVKCSGIFVWQNTPDVHVITDFVAYRNALAGVDHGAYDNSYVYQDLYLFQNGSYGIELHAFSKGLNAGQSRQTWSCVTVVDSPVAVSIEKANVDDGLPVLFQNLVTINVPTLVTISPKALAAGQTLQRRAEFVSTGVPCGSAAIGAGDSVAFVTHDAQFHLYGQLAQGSAVSSFYYGNPGDVALMGDWNCDGVDTPAMYRPSNGFMYLRNSNTQGVADVSYFYGNPSDIPIAGDFDGNGCDTLAIYRPTEGRVYVKNSLGTGVADYSYYFGNPGDKPFSGDFNGDGVDTVGLHRESSGFVYFRDSNTQGFADFSYFYGNPGDKMLAGDWDGDGDDSLAVYRPSDGKLYIRYTNTQGFADLTLTVGFFQTAVTAG